MGTQRMFLGVLINLSQALQSRSMIVDVKPGLREMLFSDAQRLLDSGTCSPGEAAKLRGRLTWAASAMFGRCARGGQGPLCARQYSDGALDITDELRSALLYVQALVQVVSPRVITLGQTDAPTFIAYSDASWEPQDMDRPGLGAVLIQGPAAIPKRACRICPAVHPGSFAAQSYANCTLRSLSCVAGKPCVQA